MANITLAPDPGTLGVTSVPAPALKNTIPCAAQFLSINPSDTNAVVKTTVRPGPADTLTMIGQSTRLNTHVRPAPGALTMTTPARSFPRLALSRRGVVHPVH